MAARAATPGHNSTAFSILGRVADEDVPMWDEDSVEQPADVSDLVARIASEVEHVGETDGKLTPWELYRCRESQKFHAAQRREAQSKERELARLERTDAILRSKRVNRGQRELFARLAQEAEAKAGDERRWSAECSGMRHTLEDANRTIQLVKEALLPRLKEAAPREDSWRMSRARIIALADLRQKFAARCIQRSYSAYRVRMAVLESNATMCLVRVLCKHKYRMKKEAREALRRRAMGYLFKVRLRVTRDIFLGWRTYVRKILRDRERFRRYRAIALLSSTFAGTLRRRLKEKRAISAALFTSGEPELAATVELFVASTIDWPSFLTRLDDSLQSRALHRTTLSAGSKVSPQLAAMLGYLRRGAPPLVAYRSIPAGDPRLLPWALWRCLQRLDSTLKVHRSRLAQRTAALAEKEARRVVEDLVAGLLLINKKQPSDGLRWVWDRESCVCGGLVQKNICATCRVQRQKQMDEPTDTWREGIGDLLSRSRSSALLTGASAQVPLRIPRSAGECVDVTTVNFLRNARLVDLACATWSRDRGLDELWFATSADVSASSLTLADLAKQPDVLASYPSGLASRARAMLADLDAKLREEHKRVSTQRRRDETSRSLGARSSRRRPEVFFDPTIKIPPLVHSRKKEQSTFHSSSEVFGAPNSQLGGTAAILLRPSGQETYYY